MKRNIVLLVIIMLLVFGITSFVNIIPYITTFLPMVHYDPVHTPTVTPTKKPPTPTATKPPISTPIPDYPYNWLKPGSAVNIGDETKIGGAKPSMCHKVFAQKSGKTIFIWVEYFGWTRDQCETAMNNDYSHVPESHFPLPVCLPPSSQYMPPPNIPCICEEFNHDYYCEAFGLDYPANSQEVCAITDGCIDVR